jgi:nucleotide-binding universal stress UspA family protein
MATRILAIAIKDELNTNDSCRSDPAVSIACRNRALAGLSSLRDDRAVAVMFAIVLTVPPIQRNRSTGALRNAKEPDMFTKILLPTDGSEMSARPIAGAIEIARALGSKVLAMMVIEPYTYASLSTMTPESCEAYEARTKEVAQKQLSAIEDAGTAAGVEVETKVSQNFSPSEAIIEMAEDDDCDAIFMASHGRHGISAILIGSETRKVLTHTTIPVLVYH